MYYKTGEFIKKKLKCNYCGKEFITSVNQKHCNRECYGLSMKGRKLSEETKDRMKLSAPRKEEKCNWKGELRKIPSFKNKALKEWRHKKGISKIYKEERQENGLGKSYTKEYKRLARKKYKYNKKQAGKLTIQTIQLVYEDNIKQFGTLTCYLCLQPILFGKDHLEHKTPLSKYGTNEYNNLGVACQRCNCKKHNKTEAEYRKEILHL